MKSRRIVNKAVAMVLSIAMLFSIMGMAAPPESGEFGVESGDFGEHGRPQPSLDKLELPQNFDSLNH